MVFGVFVQKKNGTFATEFGRTGVNPVFYNYLIINYMFPRGYERCKPCKHFAYLEVELNILIISLL